jgi:hypothetical protein
MTKMSREDAIAALDYLGRMFRRWDEFNVAIRELEDLKTTDDTFILTVPPTWPTHGAVRHWAGVMEAAGNLLKDDGRK